MTSLRVNIVDEDPDEDMWVEKNIDMEGEIVRASTLCAVLDSVVLTLLSVSSAGN